MNKQQLASKIWAGANALRGKVSADAYKDYMENGYSKDMPSGDFINNFGEKYNICIPSDIFFDEEEFMKKMIEFTDKFNL